MQFGYRRSDRLKGHQYRRIMTYALALACIVWLAIYLNQRTQAPACYMLDVGQGDCSVIIYNHRAWLIDGGGMRNITGDNVGVKVLVPFLVSQGIREIEGVFISHFHFDHVKGLMEVGERIPIRQLYVNQEKSPLFHSQEEIYATNDGYEMMMEIREWAKAHKIPVQGMKRGDRVEYKEMRLTCVTPDANVMDDVNENNHSLVIELSVYHTTMLFTGDMEKEQEALGDFSDVDILKVAHHGSSTSTTTEFLMKTRPELALISVGQNTYGHPSEEVIKRLEEQGIAIFSTIEHGMLKVTFNRNGYQLQPYK